MSDEGIMIYSVALGLADNFCSLYCASASYWLLLSETLERFTLHVGWVVFLILHSPYPVKCITLPLPQSRVVWFWSCISVCKTSSIIFSIKKIEAQKLVSSENGWPVNGISEEKVIGLHALIILFFFNLIELIPFTPLARSYGKGHPMKFACLIETRHSILFKRWRGVRNILLNAWCGG